ncbi:MAG: right-handed parallel beta-helix repeat-containing protein [Planctomycetia bacterium]|nr:right-handed parallel beta-helix repeat-containing protein [Planctomycetia bacterium]
MDDSGGVCVDSGVAATLISITNNTITNNNVSISLLGDAATCNITDNKIGAYDWSSRSDGNSGNGVYIAGTGQVTISGNTISGNGWNGIDIDRSGGGTNTLVISDNEIGYGENRTVELPNLQNGIDISGWTGSTSWTSEIDGNLVGANGYNGISLNDCHYIAVVYNTVRSNGSTSSYHGVNLQGSVSSVSVSYNTFDSNTGKAVATSSSYNQNIAISQNEYDGEGTSPISLHADSNDGINSPAIDASGIQCDGVNWCVPFSIDPCGAVFANQPLVLEVYSYSPTGVCTYLAAPGGTFDAEGGLTGYVSLLASNFAAGDQIAFLVRCTGGTAIGDTSEFSNLETIQDMPPRVVGVSVGNGTAAETFAPVAGSDAQLWTVRMCSVTTVSITFNRDDVQTDEDALTIVSRDEQTTIAADDAGEISWSPDGYTATWTLDSEVSLGEWYIVLDATQVLTPVGTQLDGEWTNPEYFGDIDDNSEFPSGNGVAGGDFQFAFTVLPGDTDRDGDVDGIDLARFGQGWYQGGDEWSEGDFDGDDDVNPLTSPYLAWGGIPGPITGPRPRAKECSWLATPWNRRT